MLDGKFQRGFSTERLAMTHEPKVRRDDHGHFIMSLSENSKVYFEDYYTFLKFVYTRSKSDQATIREKLATIPKDHAETIAFYRAKLVIIDVLQRAILRFYTDGSNLGVVMTPWCFGTVVLEKVEVYRDRLGKGEVDDPNVPEYPVLRHQSISTRSTGRPCWICSSSPKKRSRCAGNTPNCSSATPRY